MIPPTQSWRQPPAAEPEEIDTIEISRRPARDARRASRLSALLMRNSFGGVYLRIEIKRDPEPGCEARVTWINVPLRDASSLAHAILELEARAAEGRERESR